MIGLHIKNNIVSSKMKEIKIVLFANGLFT